MMRRLQLTCHICSALCLALTVLGLSSCGKSPEEALAEDWLKAVETGNEKAALEAARKLVPPQERTSIISGAYVQLFEFRSIDKAFLTRDFCNHDFKAWQDALFFKRLPFKDVPTMFVAVRQQVNGDEPKPINAWPREIWGRRFGMCDRRVWVLVEIAYQHGYEAAVVYLKDPKDKQSPHSIAEIRLGKSVWLADPLIGKLGQGRGVELLARDKELLKQMWPKHEHWQKCLEHSTIYVPSLPGDFCIRNQKLQAVLRKHLGDRCPRFGADPKERLNAYSEMRKAEVPGNRCDMTVWDHPIRVLYVDMRRSGEIKAPPPAKKATEAPDKAPTETKGKTEANK